MTFLTILGVTKIVCSFKLVLEGKICKEILESSRLEFLEKFSANNLSNDHKDCPNQHENSQKLWDEKGHPAVNLMEGQWKLRQQPDQNFPMEGKPL